MTYYSLAYGQYVSFGGCINPDKYLLHGISMIVSGTVFVSVSKKVMLQLQEDVHVALKYGDVDIRSFLVESGSVVSIQSGIRNMASLKVVFFKDLRLPTVTELIRYYKTKSI